MEQLLETIIKDTAAQAKAKEDFNKLFIQASPTSRPGVSPTSSPKKPRTPKRQRITLTVTPVSKKTKVDKQVEKAFNTNTKDEKTNNTKEENNPEA